MKKALFLLSSTLVAGALQAQTLNIVVGEVTYQVPAEQAGEMIYTSGTTLTVLNKEFTLSEIDQMYTDDTTVSDSTVTVTYNGSSAAVTVSADVMQYLTVTASGATVSVVQSSDLATEVTYTLTGTSTDGSFYMDGEYKATVILSDLTLTSSSTAPVNIENGKRIDLEIEGTNTLKDATSSDGKGALMVNGHSEIKGSGTLNIYGYAKHGYWADEYIQLKKSMTGTINILYAAKDGINVNQYFEQNGGTLNISGTLDDGIQVGADDDYTGYVNIQGGTLTVKTTAAANKSIKADGSITINEDKNTTVITVSNTGTGEWDDDDAEVKGAACMSSDGNVTIDAGTLTLTASGSGGKGLKCDSVFTLNGGTLTVTTTGKLYVQTGSSGTAYDGTYSGNIDQLNDAYKTSPKGIKAGIKADDNNGTAVGDVQVTGGTLNITCSGAQDGSEGLESKNTMTISGGTLTLNTYDDCINSANNMYITGGTISAAASGNDAIDSNGNLYLNGGNIMALGASGAENGVDAAEGYNIYFNGATLLCVGGSSITPTSSSTAPYVSTTGSISASSTIKLSSGSTTLASWTIPSYYSSSSSTRGPGGDTGGGNTPGGGTSSGGYSIIITTPDLQKNTSYTLTNGSSSTSVTATSGSSSSSWH